MPISVQSRARATAVLVASLAGSLLATATVPAHAAAPARPCKAKVVATGRTFGSLQSAVNSTPSGGTIQVRGTCVGSTIIGVDVVLVGVRSRATGAPTLSGGGTARVLLVHAGTRVTIRALTITGGRVDGETYPANSGAGMLLEGTATLRDVIVRGNHAPAAGGAGGVEIALGARLVLAGRTELRRNSGGWGGAVENYGSLLVKDDVRIHHNEARSGGGGIYSGPADGFSSVLKGRARVDHNRAPDGGGIRLSSGRLVMEGASLVDANTATVGAGGGIAVTGGTLQGATCGVRVKANTPTNVAPACP